VLGAVVPEAAWKTMTAKAGGDPRQWHTSMRPLLAAVAADYPDLMKRYDTYRDEDPGVLRALAFEYGLSCVLDGLAARLPATPAGPAPAPTSPAPAGPAPSSTQPSQATGSL